MQPEGAAVPPLQSHLPTLVIRVQHRASHSPEVLECRVNQSIGLAEYPYLGVERDRLHRQLELENIQERVQRNRSSYRLAGLQSSKERANPMVYRVL